MHTSITTTRRWAGLGLVTTAAVAAALLTPSAALADTPVSGSVAYNGAGIENVIVYVEQYNSSDGGWDYVATATTDELGNWTSTADLSDGIYSTFYLPRNSTAIYASAQGRNAVTDPDKLSREFTVTSGVADVVSIGLVTLAANAGAVQVQLRDAITGGLLTQPGVVSAEADLYGGRDANGDEVLQSGSFATEGATFDGVLVIPGLLPATYSSLFATADGYKGLTVPSSITVSAGATTNIGDLGLYSTATPSAGSLVANPKTVTITGDPKVGTLLTANVPASGASVVYQWTADGIDIPGATAQTFVPTPKQLDAVIAVSARFTAAGYSPTTFTSDATKRVKIGDPNVAVVTLSGSAKFDGTLTANVTGSTVADSKTVYQWYRNGAPIAGATGGTYTVGALDVGQSLFASITSFAQGHTDAVIPSNTLAVAKDKATLTITTASPKAGKRLTVKVVLHDGKSGVNATGKVKVYYTSKRFKTVTFTTKSTSKTVSVPAYKKGKYSIKVAYAGDAQYVATSSTKKITVR